jgi:serine/threonine protein kinase
MITINTRLQERYAIVRQIGQGGMGTVYEALDTRLGCQVAIKQLTAPTAASIQSFEHEARLLARLRHPSLIRVTDYFTDQQGLYLVMDFVPGLNLAEQLEANGRPFTVQQVMGWAERLLDVLSYLHGQSPPVIHRDIKPDNLKLTPAGEIILLDFGLAKGASGAQSDAPKSVFGYTAHYSPLEQIQGLGTEPRSDIYALGATLYHLLTNTVPPEVLARMAALIGHQPDPLVPAHLSKPQVPAGISQAISGALAINKEERIASAAELKARLQAPPPFQQPAYVAPGYPPPATSGLYGAPTVRTQGYHVPPAPPAQLSGLGLKIKTFLDRLPFKLIWIFMVVSFFAVGAARRQSLLQQMFVGLFFASWLLIVSKFAYRTSGVVALVLKIVALFLLFITALMFFTSPPKM